MVLRVVFAREEDEQPALDALLDALDNRGHPSEAEQRSDAQQGDDRVGTSLRGNPGLQLPRQVGDELREFSGLVAGQVFG